MVLEEQQWNLGLLLREEGIIFLIQLIILKAALWLSRWRKHKDHKLRGVRTEKKCCFHFKTLICIWTFSKWVLSRAILNILGILEGRPDQALLYLILIYFFQMTVVLFVFECKLFFQFCNFPPNEWFRQNGCLPSAKNKETESGTWPWKRRRNVFLTAKVEGGVVSLSCLHAAMGKPGC